MIQTSEKNQLRKKIIDMSIARQQLVIHDFKIRIKQLTETEGLGNEEAYDNTEQGNNSLKAIEINTLNKALESVIQELELLENLKIAPETNHDTISLGAIVVTNHLNLFVSIGMEEFLLEGQKFLGISTASPMFKEMKGKHKGESFQCKGINYTIIDIF